jgi:hypothetical protein
VDPYNRLRLWWRRRWEPMEARVVDTREVARKVRSEGGGSYVVQEYLVDVAGPDGGEPVRLSFKEQTHRVRGNPRRGDVVPVIVNAKRTKAMFDYRDPSIDNYGWVDEQQRRRKARDDERFEARRAGREPARRADDDEA